MYRYRSIGRVTIYTDQYPISKRTTAIWPILEKLSAILPVSNIDTGTPSLYPTSHAVRDFSSVHADAAEKAMKYLLIHIERTPRHRSISTRITGMTQHSNFLLTFPPYGFLGFMVLMVLGSSVVFISGKGGGDGHHLKGSRCPTQEGTISAIGNNK